MRFLILIALLLLPGGHLAAQANRGAAKPSLAHAPVKPEELPAPGLPMTISVALENSKNSGFQLRGYFVRDGKMIEQSLTEFSTDEFDRFVYSTSIHAPLAELSYQFVLMDGNLPIASSRRYSIRRSCLPKMEIVPAEVPDNPEMAEKLKTLQNRAATLQVEVQNYEAAIKMLDELKVLTEN